MEQKRINTLHLDKFKATHDKIGRKAEGRDVKRSIVYTILLEYYTAMMLDVKDEPEYLPRRGDKKLFRNPNYDALDLIEQELSRLDRKMRLSFYPKGV